MSNESILIFSMVAFILAMICQQMTFNVGPLYTRLLWLAMMFILAGIGIAGCVFVIVFAYGSMAS